MFFGFGKRERKTIEVHNLNKEYLSNFKSFTDALGMTSTQSVHTHDKTIFVLDFYGDVMASQAGPLTQEISSILMSANPATSEVLIRLQSPGGAAHAYGYAASQLERLRDKGFKLTVAVDKVAASGGYMMAVVADKILAAPYSIVGSVGVVAEFPNFSELLSTIGVDYLQYTAGKYKRTVSMLGPVTEEGSDKFKEDLNTTYKLFCDHVSRFRENLDIEKVATGEHWHAINAIELGLVDELKTSEEYILEKLADHNVLSVRYVGNRKTLADKLGSRLSTTVENVFLRFVTLVFGEFKYLI